MLVRQTPTKIITGVADMRNNFLVDGTISTLNATEGFVVVVVLAWGTRFVAVSIISDVENHATNQLSK